MSTENPSASTPTIDSVESYSSPPEDIPPGGTTRFTAVTIRGKAKENVDVWFYLDDNDRVLNLIAPDGTWTRAVYDLKPGTHRLRVDNGGRDSSEVRTFKVKEK
jgi:hypothetical protein